MLAFCFGTENSPLSLCFLKNSGEGDRLPTKTLVLSNSSLKIELTIIRLNENAHSTQRYFSFINIAPLHDNM